MFFAGNRYSSFLSLDGLNLKDKALKPMERKSDEAVKCSFTSIVHYDFLSFASFANLFKNSKFYKLQKPPKLQLILYCRI